MLGNAIPRSWNKRVLQLDSRWRTRAAEIGLSGDVRAARASSVESDFAKEEKVIKKGKRGARRFEEQRRFAGLLRPSQL